jgi:hypothetical protein
VDPPFWMNSYGVYIGEGSTSATQSFSGSAQVVSHTFSTTSESLTHLIGSSPCPTPFDPITVTNTGNVPLTWSTANPLAWVHLDSSGGTIPVGGNTVIHPDFPCSGYSLGVNNGTLPFTVQSSAGTPSSGPTAVSFYLLVH